MPQKILVVDDEPDLELLVKAKFRKKIRSNELEFLFAKNGCEALEKLRQNDDVQVVLTDINMPEMDGLTLLSHLQQFNRVLKAVVISAYGDMDNIRHAMNAGAFDFVVKPIDFQDLETTIDKTINACNELKEAFSNKQELSAIQKELDIARELQQSMLPHFPPPLIDRGSFQLFGAMHPARTIGGDFFDFFPIDQERLALVIGDVSGKSISAALFMAISRVALRASAAHSPLPEEIVAQTNALLAKENDAGMFVTLFFAILNVRTGLLSYCNAGHLAPYLIGQTGTCSALPQQGNLALGLCEQEELSARHPYTSKQHQLSAGDLLLLYTDGINEATDRSEMMFGCDRIQTFLKEHRAEPLETLCETLIAQVNAFAGEVEQFDDQTLLALRWGPIAAASNH